MNNRLSQSDIFLFFRLANLELMSEYGSESWKSFNETQQKVLSCAQKELALLRAQIQDIHLQRKRKQTEAGEKLKTLETRYYSQEYGTMYILQT